MKRFTDLHLRVPLDDQAKAESMIRKASGLGYNLVGIPFSPQTSRKQISQLEQICNDAKVDFATRVNFSPRNSNELLQSLRRYRRKFEIVAVRCHTKDVARQAAKDRRVDLLQFSVTNIRKRFFDQAEAELASQAFSSLEIELAPILQLTSFSRIRLLSRLRREVETAERLRVPITLSSGATEEQLMRGPHDYAALTTLFDMSMSSALRALSENPWVTVARNREKLSSDYVAPGIRVVGRKAR
ncbi:MAG: RNase P subunit p30 family protein [Candidatus Bathyarchaeota archaeon]|jgi:RNase P/RNase MRP subunit p30